MSTMMSAIGTSKLDKVKIRYYFAVSWEEFSSSRKNWNIYQFKHFGVWGLGDVLYCLKINSDPYSVQ